MLGRSLPQGSEAISFHNTLFRISELCWIKAVRLSIPEIVVRVLCVILGVGWFFAMEKAKGTYVNLEFLLGVFPLILAWTTAGSLKIGCTGDFEETYEGRRGMQTSLFRSWIEGIRKREPAWLHLKSSNYDLLLNPNRVAWVRPCFQWKLYPLVVMSIFASYLYLISLGLDFETYPVLDEFQVLIFEGGADMIQNLSFVVIFTAFVAFVLSIKRSVEVCGTGGVQDVFPLSSDDQSTVLGILAGSEVKSTSRSVTAEVKKASPPAAQPEKAAERPKQAAEQPKKASPQPKPQPPSSEVAQKPTEHLKVSAAEPTSDDPAKG